MPTNRRKTGMVGNAHPTQCDPPELSRAPRTLTALVGGNTIAYAAYMDRRLPFAGRIFWKVLVVIAVLAVVSWIVIVKVTEYQMEPQDYGGSIISGVIFAYLVHLWLLPKEE